jgi:hypothetical protein
MPLLFAEWTNRLLSHRTGKILCVFFAESRGKSDLSSALRQKNNSKLSIATTAPGRPGRSKAISWDALPVFILDQILSIPSRFWEQIYERGDERRSDAR